MDTGDKSEAFYKKLKSQLNDTSLWPAPYLFKFIVESDASKVKQVTEIFNHAGAIINTKESRSGKYTSVSVNVKMKNPDAVIAKYKEASGIEGIISL